MSETSMLALCRRVFMLQKRSKYEQRKSASVALRELVLFHRGIVGGEVLGGTDFTDNPPLQEKSDVIIPIRRVSAIPSDNISCSQVPYASVEQGGLVRIPDTQTKAPQSTSPQKHIEGYPGIGYRVS